MVCGDCALQQVWVCTSDVRVIAWCALLPFHRVLIQQGQAVGTRRRLGHLCGDVARLLCAGSWFDAPDVVASSMNNHVDFCSAPIHKLHSLALEALDALVWLDDALLAALQQL